MLEPPVLGAGGGRETDSEQMHGAPAKTEEKGDRYFSRKLKKGFRRGNNKYYFGPVKSEVVY